MKVRSGLILLRSFLFQTDEIHQNNKNPEASWGNGQEKPHFHRLLLTFIHLIGALIIVSFVNIDSWWDLVCLDDASPRSRLLPDVNAASEEPQPNADVTKTKPRASTRFQSASWQQLPHVESLFPPLCFNNHHDTKRWVTWDFGTFGVGTRSSGDVTPPAGRILLKVVSLTFSWQFFLSVLLFRLCEVWPKCPEIFSPSGSSTVALTLHYGFANLVYRIKFPSLAHVSLSFIIRHLTCLELNKAHLFIRWWPEFLF